MGLKDYWQQQFGESNNPYAHVLLRVDFLFTSDGTTKLDVLSMQVYSIVSEVMKQFEEGETAQTIEGDTAWKLFNAFTYPIFNPTSTKMTVDAAEVAYTGAVGNRAQKVSKIFNVVYNETMRMAA